MWTGDSNGTQVSVQSGKYVFDNSDASTQSDSNGYTFPILVGAARDVMLSVNGDMECLTGDCAWGVFIRSTGETMTYIFMIHNDGNYSLTGLSPQETDQALGNIQAASNSIIRKSGENTIVAIAEGAQMMFFVNDVLLAAHEAYDASNPTFGVIVWGSPGTKAKTRLDDILAKAN